MEHGSRIVVVGSSGHAKVVIDSILRAGQYELVGLIDSFRPVGTKVFDLSVLGSEDELVELAEVHRFCGGVVAIGDNWTRFQVVRRISQVMPRFRFVCAVHPVACLGKGVVVGEGSVVMAGAVVNADAQVGEHCIINTGASLDHDCWTGHFVSLMPHAAVGGGVTTRDRQILPGS